MQRRSLGLGQLFETLGRGGARVADGRDDGVVGTGQEGGQDAMADA